MQPELIIQYIRPIWRRVAFLFILSPFVALFLTHCVILLLAAKALLSLDFRQLVHILSYTTDNPFHVLTFVFTFLLLGWISWYGSDNALTTTELQATNEEILLTHKTLWRFYEVSIPSNNIIYLYQASNRDGINGDSWSLEAVTNQRLSGSSNSVPTWLSTKWEAKALDIRLNYRVVSLFKNSSRSPVEWLGKVLSSFYKIEQRSQLDPL